MWATGLSHIAFIMLGHVPSIQSFFKTFIVGGYWVLSKAFSRCVEVTVTPLPSSLFIYTADRVDMGPRLDSFSLPMK